MKPFKSYLSEGRPSQRHPLEGHEYHKKTDAQLEYIAKDAHEAAEAMKGHNTTAENKYRDQANDSATVRYWRKKNGMPDWYKKKYGHMKEETEIVEQKTAKSGVIETDVFGIRAYHSKCLEPGCKFESKRFSNMKKAQEAAKKHAEKEHFVKEEVEQIEEIHTPGTKVKVAHQGKMISGKVVRHDKGDKHGSPFYVVDVGAYRSENIPAHKVQKEEVEQIEELSTELLGRYKKAAGASASAADKAGDFEKGNKRFAGINKATLKQFKNAVKKEEVEELDEKIISVRNATGHLMKVASQFKDIYKKHGYKPVPGTRFEDYEEDDGPLTEDQLEQIEEVAAWQRKEGKNPEGGLNQKGVESYRRENPGSKLQTAVTTEPSKLKPGSKAAKRRLSFCRRMKGMKSRLTNAKNARDPDSPINKALRRWNC